MSQKSNRPQHDRSKRIKENENNIIIQLIEREDGVVIKYSGDFSYSTMAFFKTLPQQLGQMEYWNYMFC
jgi:hypothetical protein